jgi:hypothetical protein
MGDLPSVGGEDEKPVVVGHQKRKAVPNVKQKEAKDTADCFAPFWSR